MLRRVEVLRGVLVLTRIATPHVAAKYTFAQVYPGVAHPEALFAAIG